MTPHLVADEIRRRGHDVRPPALLGRLRPLPQGVARGRRPGLGRAHRQAADLACRRRPAARYPNWAEHFKAPIDRRARPARRRGSGGQPDADVHQRAPTRAGPARHARAAAHRRDPRPVPHQADPRSRPARDEAEEPMARARRPRTTAARPSGTSRTSRTARLCERDTTTVTGYDDATTAMTYICQAASPRRSRCGSSAAASWCGRSTGRCGGRTRASSSSRRAWTTSRRARPSWSGASSSARSSAPSRRSDRCTPSSASVAWRR